MGVPSGVCIGGMKEQQEQSSQHDSINVVGYNTTDMCSLCSLSTDLYNNSDTHSTEIAVRRTCGLTMLLLVVLMWAYKLTEHIAVSAYTPCCVPPCCLQMLQLMLRGGIMKDLPGESVKRLFVYCSWRVKIQACINKSFWIFPNKFDLNVLLKTVSPKAFFNKTAGSLICVKSEDLSFS